jgi:hypothetical protein
MVEAEVGMVGGAWSAATAAIGESKSTLGCVVVLMRDRKAVKELTSHQTAASS